MGFSAEWLTLRAAADARARNQDLQRRFSSLIGTGPHRVLDLGSGTGANMLALSPVLDGPQHWFLTDHDSDLLDRATAPEGVDLTLRRVDLGAGLTSVFDSRPTLVTASAFFDLCGIDLIKQVVFATVAAKASFYTVLTYDGREVWSPPHAEDQAVLQAFHQDQCRDKGLGSAAGPAATDALASAFQDAGYRVEVGASDWDLRAPHDSDLIAALAAGSAAATEDLLGMRSTDWRRAREAAEKVVIGHQDLFAWPG